MGDTTPIAVKGHTIHVTRNLKAALGQIARKSGGGRPFLLWLDAFCIDQTDDLERNSQMKLMKEIYGRADLVFAWLGPEADGSDLALQSIKWLSGFVAAHEILRTVDTRYAPKSKREHSTVHALLKPLDFGEEDVHEIIPLRALEALLKRSWWRVYEDTPNDAL